MSKEVQQRAREFVQEGLGKATEMFLSAKTPMFTAIDDVLTDTKRFIGNAYKYLWLDNENTIVNTMKDLQNLVLAIFKKYDINYISFFTMIAFLFLAAVLYSVITSFASKVPEKTFYNGTFFKYVYILVWTIILLFGFVNIAFKESPKDVEYFYKFSPYINCILVSAAIFFLVSLFLATMPISSVVLPALSLIAIGYVKYTNSEAFTTNKVVVLLLCVNLIVSAGFVLHKTENSFVNNFRSAFKYTLINVHILYPVYFLSTLFQFCQFYSLWVIFNNVEQDSYSIFILSFLFAWSFFSISYFNRLFTAIYLKDIYFKNKEDYTHSFVLLRTVGKMYDSFNYLSFHSFIPALFHSVHSLLTTIYIFLGKSEIILLYLLSYLFYVLVGVSRLLVLMLDAKTSVALTKLGFMGQEEYLKSCETEIINDKISLEYIKPRFFGVFEIQFICYCVLSGLFFSNYSLFLSNFTYLTFPLFMSLNILIYFFNALYISHKVRIYYRSQVGPKDAGNSVRVI